jgi:hypothetical protein
MLYYYMTGARHAPSRRALAAFLCLASAGCSKPPLSYTLPAGTVDARPVSPFGPLRPKGYLALFDPAKGRPVQVFADEAIGGHVADFVDYNLVPTHWADWLFFYPPAGRGPGPGLCRSKAYLANSRSDDKGNAPGVKGRWQPDVYAVAGSVAPLPRPWPAGYQARLEAACAERRDMGSWYGAPPGKAYSAARMADSVVAAARRPGALPFRLACRPFPPDMREAPLCAADVRKTVAAADPRAIVWVTECHEETKLPCLAVGLAQHPEHAGSAAEDQWTLNVQYRGDSELRIERVDVDDTHIIFE